MRKVSAAALTGARNVLREYTLTLKPGAGVPGMTAHEGHVAIVIDHATGVYKIAQLRPELSYWHRQLTARTATAPQLAGFLKKVSETLREIPVWDRTETPVIVSVPLPPVAAVMGPQVKTLSKASVEAAKYLLHYYAAARVHDGGWDEPDRQRIASLVDLNLGLTHAMKALPLAEQYLKQLKLGQVTEKEVRSCYRDLGTYLGFLPIFSRNKEEMLLVAPS